jgi:hypothetical protein
MKKLNRKAVRAIETWEIQDRASWVIERELNNKELKQVVSALNLKDAIDAAIKRVTSFNGLIERNREAKLQKTHYVVYQKDLYEKESAYKKNFFALNEKDAREYVLFRPAEVTRITKVKVGTEEEIFKKEESFAF